MNFLDNVLDKTKMAVDFMGNKTEELSGKAKLKLDLIDAQKKVYEQQANLGELVYNLYQKDESNDTLVMEYIENLEVAELKLQALTQKMEEISQIKICSTCGTKNSDSHEFCCKCGLKL